MQAAVRSTAWAGGRVLQFRPDTENVENQVINLYPHRAGQTWEGFGTALTGAAGAVYARMSPANRQALMAAYFSPDQMCCNLVRLHMDSCDFCPAMYEADSDPEDAQLERFDFSYTEEHLLPMLRDAQAAAGQTLGVMLSPWSPPAYMKTNGQRRGGGHLKREFYGRWAEYICRYIMEFRARGFRVERISLQNEPNAAQVWDSCLYTPEEERDFLMVMHDALVRHKLEDVELFIWDHNKERAWERAMAVLNGEAASLAAGVACHWYSGDHFEALDMLREDRPELKLILSESCIEYSKYGRDNQQADALRLAHEIIGDLNHGICAFYDWNLLLDEKGGPNHAGNFCHAPFLYDRGAGELRPQLLQRYFTLLSRTILPGSVRAGVSRFTDRCDAAAFRRPDGTLGVLLLNRERTDMEVHLRLSGQTATLDLPGESLTACVIAR